MSGWLLDTNVLAELTSERPDSNVRRWIDGQASSRFFMSALSFGEYEKGLAKLDDDDPRRRTIRRTIETLEVDFERRILPVDDRVIRTWGRISGLALRQRRNLHVTDALLAATAIVHGLTVATRNTRDMMDTTAPFFNPWESA